MWALSALAFGSQNLYHNNFKFCKDCGSSEVFRFDMKNEAGPARKYICTSASSIAMKEETENRKIQLH